MSINTDDVNRSASGRGRGRPALPLERIVGAALELVDESGPDALSMRNLAQRLGSGTATLYRHFADRDALVAEVVDRMLGEVALDSSSSGTWAWQDVCISFGQKMFDALSRHGNAAPLLVGHIPMGPNAMAHREHILQMLLDNGFAPATAACVYATLSRYVLGFSMQVPGSAPGAADDAALTAFGQLDPARYPATLAAADSLPVALADEFAFGLRLIVSGLAPG